MKGPHNNIKQREINIVNDNLKLSPAVYNSSELGLFKLVLEWNFNIKNEEKTFNILSSEAEQTWILKLDGNKDRETLLNFLNSSHLHFDLEIKERLKKTALANYSLKGGDFGQSADNILALVRKYNVPQKEDR